MQSPCSHLAWWRFILIITAIPASSFLIRSPQAVTAYRRTTQKHLAASSHHPTSPPPTPPPPPRKGAKRRVDELLLERQLVATAAEANKLVMSGTVILDDTGEVVASAATKVDEGRALRLRSKKAHEEPYVSRAGRKLAHAIDTYNLTPALAGAVCIDLGSSTGGFTDVLLHHANVKKVYAVDVGVSLLDWKIRSDPRVVVVEKQNARYMNATVLAPEDVGRVGAVVCDVSFISLRLVLPPSLQLCQDNAVLCALIKPQFEAARHETDGGIVRDPAVRDRVVAEFQSWFGSGFPGWTHIGTVESPITGHDGNTEFVFVAQKC